MIGQILGLLLVAALAAAGAYWRHRIHLAREHRPQPVWVPPSNLVRVIPHQDTKR